jgi:hypothetical protein
VLNVDVDVVLFQNPLAKSVMSREAPGDVIAEWDCDDKCVHTSAATAGVCHSIIPEHAFLLLAPSCESGSEQLHLVWVAGLQLLHGFVLFRPTAPSVALLDTMVRQCHPRA